MTKPLLSIVIPTHNRSEYAIYSIDSILSIDCPDIEIVVTDTSDDKELATAVEKYHDSRLVYLHLDEPLSMTENHNRAMSLASGEYVCLIGDDDTISTEAINAVRWAYSKNIDALSPVVVANYAWPDFRTKYLGSAHAGRLYIRRSFGNASLRDSKRDLFFALDQGALGTEGLPKIYHGIVRREVLDKIKMRSGSYFHGLSPDVSGAISLAIVLDQYVEIEYPLTIPGASSKSNTGRSALKLHKGTIENDPHTKRFKDIYWPSVIPRFFSVETAWAQSVYQTLKVMDMNLIKDYNLFQVYAACLLRHLDYRSAILNAVYALHKDLSISSVDAYMRLSKAFLRESSKTAKSIVRRTLVPTVAGGRDFVGGLANIHEAQIALSVELNRRCISFDNIMSRISLRCPPEFGQSYKA